MVQSPVAEGVTKIEYLPAAKFLPPTLTGVLNSMMVWPFAPALQVSSYLMMPPNTFLPFTAGEDGGKELMQLNALFSELL